MNSQQLVDRRAHVEWVNTHEVMPNPLNPRKNDAVKSEEMQEIIRKRGWEEPLTVYKKGDMYVVLAGHRRLYAAKQVNVKQLPVFVVEAPNNHQEEIERIASLQRGRQDWTQFEWGKFTYERWLAWGKTPIAKFAKDIGISAGVVKRYLTVLDYFPRFEIEGKLEAGIYAMATLEWIALWIQRAKKYKPEIIEKMTEEMVRKVMLNKLEKKLVSRDDLAASDPYLQSVTDEDFLEFLTSNEIPLRGAQEKYGLEKKNRTFRGHMISIGAFNSGLSSLEPLSKEETEKALAVLDDLRKTIEAKMNKIKTLAETK